MSKLVEVPGVGNVEFPDAMSDSAIETAIKDTYAPNAGLAQPAKPQLPEGLKPTPQDGMIDYAQSRNETAQKYLKSLMNFAIGGAGGGKTGLIGGSISGGSTALSPESGPTTTGAGIGSLIADKVVPGSGAAAGGLKGLMALIGAKGGQAVAGQDASLKPEDAVYPAMGALTSPITKGLNKAAKYIHDSSPVTKSQSLMDALKQKLSGGVTGNATQPLASEVTSGIRSDVNAAHSKFTADQIAAKNTNVPQINKVTNQIADQGSESARLTKEIADHKNEAKDLGVQIKAEWRKLHPGEDEPLKEQATAITKPMWQRKDALEQMARDKQTELKAIGVRTADSKAAKTLLETQQKEAALKGATPPKALKDIENGPAVLKDLAASKTGEEFNDKIYKGGREYIQVAKRMIGNDPEKLEKLRVGFVSHVTDEGYDKLTGLWSSKTIADRFDTAKGQSILKELYPDVTELNRKISDVKEVLKPGSPVLQWKTLGALGGLGTSVAIVRLAMGHPEEAMLEGGIAAASFAKIGAGELINKMLTDDKIRAGMLDYFKTGTVDNVSRSVANATHAFLASHEVKQPAQAATTSPTPATTPPNPSSEIQSPPLSASAPIR